MTHRTLPRFWDRYNRLPLQVQQLADKNYQLLKSDPFHPSLHFKKVGKRRPVWSARVGAHYRALGLETAQGIVWFWIGSHAEYDNLLPGL